jgi:predicted TIM-barrel fold metal-dependent hydrolase
MIIDIHTHCFPDELALKAIPLLSEKAGIKSFSDGTVKQLKKSMAVAGIDISVLQPIATKPEQTKGINRWAVSVQDKNIITFGTIHPDFADWKDEIRWLTEAGIRGVKFHPEYQDFFVDDPKMFPIYEELAKAGLIILFHAGVDLGYTAPYHCTPCRLEKILDSFPNATIIAAHMGGYRYWDDVEKYLIGKNVYFDTSYALEELGNERAEQLIKAHGVQKVLFGTDSPWRDQTKEISFIRSLNLRSAEINEILGKNASRILRKEKI